MGRSSSCFKIITCGSDSADQDELQPSESKNSSEKRGWSFRKRCASHRVLSNTVVSETASSGNKERPESASLNFQSPANSTVPEKISILHNTDEKPPLSTLVNSKISENIVAENEVATENESKVDVKLDESIVIVIQAAIRGLLAQRALLKLKNVVKLQAVVRGHLVRRHAVGTLRCVQAIVKMQVLVRARHARMSLEGSHREEKLDGKYGKDDYSLETLGKENSVKKLNGSYTSIEKLLSNRFARQLLESTPKTQHINIKCDPSKPNSAWNWLERWMSVLSTNIVESQKPKQQENGKDETSALQVGYQIPSEALCQSADSKHIIMESTEPSEIEENLITHDAGNFNFEAFDSTSSAVIENMEQHRPENAGSSEAKESSLEINSLPNQTLEPDANSQTGLNSLPCDPEMESEQTKHSMKRFASEQLETEGKKLVFGSRKASNPAFIAAQSKFEELSSTANSGGSISSSYQDVGVGSNMDTVLSVADTVLRTTELSIANNSAPHTSRVQFGGSESGTELSISSTLDSPDRSEVGAAESVYGAKVSEDGTCNLNCEKNLDVEAKDASTFARSRISYFASDQPQKLDVGNGESLNSVVAVESPQVELKPERSASDLHRELDSQRGCQAYRSSPEASPRSHMTILESQGTPSSQVSVKAKRTKTDKSGSGQKRKSLSAGKKSPSNPNHDSGASCVDQLPKDHKNGKRSNPFDLKPDHIDQEPRDSSSSNTIPHFMQATESARAKVQANNSPRSSPDVQDSDIYIKKRHSLPGANGRQGSPRIQRSMSQAQKGAKGNMTHPHERKWQR